MAAALHELRMRQLIQNGQNFKKKLPKSKFIFRNTSKCERLRTFQSPIQTLDIKIDQKELNLHDDLP